MNAIIKKMSSYLKLRLSFAILFFIVFFSQFTPSVFASHSWENYHWARTSNPFTLKLGDNLTSAWDPYLTTSSADWSTSTILDTTIVPGLTTARRCRPASGRVEVCNYAYGNNGWLGLAQVWISGNHITQGVTKVNDTYFKTSKYNTTAWKNLVLCQEVGHAFGLDHQDEAFDNSNLGTCMDYASNPDSNQHPNLHDYEQLELIYSHLDTLTTIQNGTQKLPSLGQSIAGFILNTDLSNPKEWGQELKNNKKVALFVRDLGNGQKVFTHVIWAQ